jgi:5,10-methylenetetrahydrofolate reductase
MNFSVELEPPNIRSDLYQYQKSIQEETLRYAPYIKSISITNRPVFGLNPSSTAKIVRDTVQENNFKEIKVNLHITTRHCLFDVFREVFDAHRFGIDEVMPILGDPRGPKENMYFENGFDILGFVSYLRNGDKSYLKEKYLTLAENGGIREALEGVEFSIPTVINPNPYLKFYDSLKQVSIREKELKFALKKEQLGADYLISQAIFDPDYYFSFLEETSTKIPIIPSVLPARLQLIKQFNLPCPKRYINRLKDADTKQSERLIGNTISNEIVQDLNDRGIKDVHIFSIGNPDNFFDVIGLTDEFESVFTTDEYVL